MKLPLALWFIFHSAQATPLYSTDFDNFTVGDDQWAGTDGWVITDSASGISFIDNTGFGGALGNYAALGLGQPTTRRVSVLKQILHDHTTTGESIIRIDEVEKQGAAKISEGSDSGKIANFPMSPTGASSITSDE